MPASADRRCQKIIVDIWFDVLSIFCSICWCTVPVLRMYGTGTLPEANCWYFVRCFIDILFDRYYVLLPQGTLPEARRTEIVDILFDVLSIFCTGFTYVRPEELKKKKKNINPSSSAPSPSQKVKKFLIWYVEMNLNKL